MSYQCCCLDDGANDRGEYGLRAGAWMGRRGEGVRARLPRTGCGLCARKLTVISEPEQEARVPSGRRTSRAQCCQRSRKQSHSAGITPRDPWAWRWHNWEGEATLRGAGGVHGRKTQLKLSPGQHPVIQHLNSGFCSCFAFISSALSLEGSETLIHKTSLP